MNVDLLEQICHCGRYMQIRFDRSRFPFVFIAICSCNGGGSLYGSVLRIPRLNMPTEAR